VRADSRPGLAPIFDPAASIGKASKGADEQTRSRHLRAGKQTSIARARALNGLQDSRLIYFDFARHVAICGHMKKKRRIHSTYPEAKAQELSIKEAAAAYGVECGVVNVREAKDHLSSLLDRAERGERIVVTSDGRPKAMIVRYRPMIQGAKWTSLRALREKTTIVEDSTPILRAERDSGY
jgi:prevent-host-death family protein